MKASVESGFLVLAAVHVLDGETVAEVDGCVDYDDFKALPRVIRFQGLLLGRTGWNSDTGRACYKSEAQVAEAV